MSPRDDYLVHYGVKGMKWGVRRMEERGGNYTKKGIKRFNTALEEYETASQSTDRKVQRLAKRNLNKSYKNLKQDYRADQGREVYSRGTTVGKSQVKQVLSVLGVAAVSSIASSTLQAAGKDEAALAVRILGGAAAVGLAAKGVSERSKLRAYYVHH